VNIEFVGVSLWRSRD